MKILFQFIWRLAVRFVLPRAIRFPNAPRVRLVPGCMRFDWARDASGVCYPTSEAFFARDDGVVVGKLTFAIHSDIFQREFLEGLSDMDMVRARLNVSDQHRYDCGGAVRDFDTPDSDVMA